MVEGVFFGDGGDMDANTQKLSIRLLQEHLSPTETLREGATLVAWSKLEGARIDHSRHSRWQSSKVGNVSGTI